MSANLSDDCLTPEEEARMELQSDLNATRWPIEDEGYLEALDEACGPPSLEARMHKGTDDFAAILSREGSDYQMEVAAE